MYGRALSKNTTSDKWGDWGRVLRYNQIQGWEIGRLMLTKWGP